MEPPLAGLRHRRPRGGAGAVWGVGELGWQGIKSSTVYERFDPEGSAEARQGFADGAEYAWNHPWETTKAVLGINHFENGEPGKFVGEVGITALVTLASGGAGAGAKVASGTSKVSKVADDAVDLGNTARAADDAGDLQKLGKLDYSERFPNEARNFAEPIPKPVTSVSTEDRWIANVGDSSREVGSGRGVGWWVDLEDARKFESVEQIRDDLALPEQWFEGEPHQAKDEILIARIPAGQETTRLEGFAKEQLDVPDPRPGGGRQIFFKEFDAGWIEARISTDDFLAGREPHLPGLPPR